MKLLVLHNRPCSYSNLIWSVAIKNGWKTHRAVASDDLGKISTGYDHVRYYGNTLHANYLMNAPFKFHVISPELLSSISSYCPGIVGREIISMKYGELPLQDGVRVWDERVFVKPAYEKYFEARVYEKGEPIGNESCKPEDLIYVQGIIDPIDEIRCFVLNGEILTASYYRKDREFWPEWIEEVPQIITERVQGICRKSNIFHGIVLDFARIGYDNWVFLEANEAWASGLYDCDPTKCLEVIEGSQFTL